MHGTRPRIVESRGKGDVLGGSSHPIGSMGLVYSYLHLALRFMVNVVKYTIHGSYGHEILVGLLGILLRVYLVGGFNPFAKNLSKWESSPNRGENKKKTLKPPPRFIYIM